MDLTETAIALGISRTALWNVRRGAAPVPTDLLCTLRRMTQEQGPT